MIRLSFMFVVLFLFLINAASFAGETIQSEISKVTLFTNQAFVERETVTTAKEGLNEISLELKAANIDEESVQATVFGEGEVFSVQVKEIPLKESPQENIKSFEQRIEKLKNDKQLLIDQKEICDKKDKFLNSMIEFSQAKIPEDMKTNFPDTNMLSKTLLFLEENYSNIYNKMQGLDTKIKDIDKEINVLEKELSALTIDIEKKKRVIEVLFNSTKQQQIKVKVSYLVYDAYWEPFYKVEVPLNFENINLIMFSKIKQRTGEDWKQINLSVSNVIPLRGVGLPDISSWILDIERRRYLVAEMSKAQLDAAKDRVLSEMEYPSEKEAEFIQAQKKELPLSFEYVLPKTIDIPSQDKYTLLPLFSKKINGVFSYYAIPKINPLVFLVCNASSSKELLSAPLNVYFAGRYIGKTFINEKKPGESFNISLGADREVKVKKEKIEDKIKETFFGKIERETIVRELVYKITIENNKDKDINIKILDNIPVSQTDQIEVKDLKITPEPKEKNYQDKKGVLLWEFGLKPKEKKEINISFIVTHPKNATISGL